MKKLLLVSILCLPHIARPMTAPQAACSAAIVGGMVTTAYSLYQWHALEIKKTTVTTQLNNPRLQKAERDALVHSLRLVKNQLARYEVIIFGSGLLTLAGYSLFPTSSSSSKSSSYDTPKPYVKPAPISLVNAVKLLNPVGAKYECPICLNEYSPDNRIWCQWHGGCNHALCKTCEHNILNSNKIDHVCPQCQAPY